ncbi:MAG: response regulator, partial [Desulfobacteraceae bacterium]|nr:response regulator [Desulfobacteraceae bacterium]
GRNMPIIALTADILKTAGNNSLDAGMSDYIIKPIRKNDLLAKIDKHLSENKSSPDMLSAQIFDISVVQQSFDNDLSRFGEYADAVIGKIGEEITYLKLAIASGCRKFRYIASKAFRKPRRISAPAGCRMKYSASSLP